MKPRLSALLAFVALLAGLVLTSCGPVQSTAKLLDASAALEAATRIEAYRWACFEYYSAWSHLKKAKEEHGYSDFEAATDLAERARAYAVRARDLARKFSVVGARPLAICRSPKSYGKKKGRKVVPRKKGARR